MSKSPLPRVGIEAEQGAHGDPQGQRARPVVDVDRRCPAPAVERALGLAHHRLGRGRDPLAVEGGHHDPPRAVVVAAVDREHPVAEQRDEVAEAALAPAEVGRVLDEDVVVGLGSEHEDPRGVQDAHREHGPVLAVAVEQHRQRVARDLPGALDAEAGRPGGSLPSQARSIRRSCASRFQGLKETGCGAAAIPDSLDAVLAGRPARWRYAPRPRAPRPAFRSAGPARRHRAGARVAARHLDDDLALRRPGPAGLQRPAAPQGAAGERAASRRLHAAQALRRSSTCSTGMATPTITGRTRSAATSRGWRRASPGSS